MEIKDIYEMPSLEITEFAASADPIGDSLEWDDIA